MSAVVPLLILKYDRPEKTEVGYRLGRAELVQGTIHHLNLERVPGSDSTLFRNPSTRRLYTLRVPE